MEPLTLKCEGDVPDDKRHYTPQFDWTCEQCDEENHWDYYLSYPRMNAEIQNTLLCDGCGEEFWVTWVLDYKVRVAPIRDEKGEWARYDD